MRRKRASDGAALSEVGGERLRVGPWTMHARVARAAPRHPEHQVVLVHGLVASSRYMVPLIERLGVHFSVACPDLPGFGRSDKPRSVLTIRQLADALLGWMDAAGIERAALLGNSLGCQIAVEAALRRPDRVGALVLQGPTPDPTVGTGFMQAARLLFNSAREESVGVGPALDYIQAGPSRALKTARQLLQDPIEKKLPRVQAPALVVRGSQDPVVSARWARRAAELLPRGELRVVPGATHTIVAVSALELTRLTVAFLLGRAYLDDLLFVRHRAAS